MTNHDINRYCYSVFWSADDNAFVATCAEFPSLSGVEEDADDALRECKFVVKEAVKWLLEDGEPVPEPLGTKKFSGKISLRIPDHLHRKISIEAAKSKVSINQYITSKLL